MSEPGEPAPSGTPAPGGPQPTPGSGEGAATALQAMIRKRPPRAGDPPATGEPRPDETAAS